MSIVHSDIKPDNILLEINKTEDSFTNVKLIDFGSAFYYDEIGSISAATPEYMFFYFIKYNSQIIKLL